MRDYDINKQGGKKMVNPITPEHNGPNGSKIPDFFQRIAQNIPQTPEAPQIPMRPGDQTEVVGGQNLQFLGPQGLVHGGPNTDVVGEQFPVETVGEPVEYKDGMPVDKDYTIRKR